MTPDDATTPAPAPPVGRLRRFAVEAAIGLGLGALLVWTLVVANGEVPFVYQGL